MVVDVHFHQVPLELFRSLTRTPIDGVTLLGAPDKPGARIVFPDRVPVPVPVGMADWTAALAHLSTYADSAVVSPWVSMLGTTLAPDAAVAYTARLNDAMAEAALQTRTPSGQRVWALATLPLANPQAARAELRRAVSLGLVGAFLGTNVSGVGLDDPQFAPVWDEAERLGVPVVLHPVDVVATRLERANLENLLGNPFDTTIAAARLIFGGVLDRHPDLHVVLSHGGGYLPYGIGRLDQGFVARRGGPLGSEAPPSRYLRRFHYDAVVYAPRVLQFLLAQVGADRVMLGTDFPFDMEVPDPRGLVRSAAPDPAAQQAVLETTAAQLFSLPNA